MGGACSRGRLRIAAPGAARLVHVAKAFRAGLAAVRGPLDDDAGELDT